MRDSVFSPSATDWWDDDSRRSSTAGQSMGSPSTIAPATSRKSGSATPQLLRQFDHGAANGEPRRTGGRTFRNHRQLVVVVIEFQPADDQTLFFNREGLQCRFVTASRFFV